VGIKLARVTPGKIRFIREFLNARNANTFGNGKFPIPCSRLLAGFQQSLKSQMRSRKNPAWNEADDERLRQLIASGASVVRAAAAFNRTIANIRTQARKLDMPFPSISEARKKMMRVPSNRSDDNPKSGST
jgi:hypothetical protein